MIAGAPLLAAAAACGLLPSEALELRQREIHIADIVSLDCIAPSERRSVGALIIAVPPNDRRSAFVTRAALADLARRRVPALSDLGVGDGGEIVTLRGVARREAVDDLVCYVAAHVIEAGEALDRASLVSAPCSADRGRASLRYERLHGTVRAAERLAAGDYLGRVIAPREAFPDAEDALTLTVAAGPVRVERDVVAVQPSLGEAIFVRDQGGLIFRAPTASLQPREAAP